MELSGNWEAIVADDARRRTWLDEALAHGDANWTPVQVPGHWRSTPAFADCDGPLLHRTRFEHPPPEGDDRWWLCFDGLFYQGDIWLDGAYVGDTEGYFFPHTFEVTAAMAERTEHVLGVEVACGRPGDLTAKRNITGVFQHSSYLDPEWNPGGIWQPVRLERTGPVRIRHLRVVCTEATEARATVSFRAVLDAVAPTEVCLRSSVGATATTDRRRIAAGENQVEWQLRIDEPALWWPHALGDQPLHEVVVEVAPMPGTDGTPVHERSGVAATPGADSPDTGDPSDVPAGLTDVEPGEVSHRLTRRIGLRQVDLRAWVLHVNGERLFLKGANVGPTRMALAEATPEELAADVRLAREANLDLVRVHGHISRPELYAAADEAGMLIWQDFPLQWGYARTIRKQAQRQAREAVDLLGHHPSVAIWCAHNEPVAVDVERSDEDDIGSLSTRSIARQQLPTWNRTVLDRTVKRALDRADGSRPVIPHSGVLPHPPLLDGTDAHLWFGWYHHEARDLAGFARLLPRQVRFVGEFGAQAVPSSADFCRPEHWPDLDWDRLAARHGLQKHVFDRRVPPEAHGTFEAWSDATQAYQADLLRHHVETLRRLKYRPTGGFAQFLLADGHPGVTWSVLDHRRVPKAGYAALRDACRPMIVVADRLPATVEAGDTLALDVHVVNDLRTPVEDVEVAARLRWTGGEQRWRFGGDVPADSCVRIGTLPVVVPAVPGPMTLDLELSGKGVPDDPVHRTDRTVITAA